MILVAHMSGRKTLFLENKILKVHYVPTNKWKEYLAVRKNIPTVTKLFDTLEGARKSFFEECKNN